MQKVLLSGPHPSDQQERFHGLGSLGKLGAKSVKRQSRTNVDFTPKKSACTYHDFGTWDDFPRFQPNAGDFTPVFGCRIHVMGEDQVKYTALLDGESWIVEQCLLNGCLILRS